MTSGIGPPPDLKHRAVLVAFGLGLTFATVSARKLNRPGNKIPIYDLLLIGLVITTCVYAILTYDRNMTKWMESTPVDLIFGACLTLLTLEAARRSVGTLFPSLGVIMLLYAYFGPVLPGLLRHPPISAYVILNTLYQTTEGIFGLLTGVVSTVIAIFIIFGAVLVFSGGGQVFMDIALRLTGKTRGGPALVAVVASSLFGTTTGNFTIPLMKSLGYRPEFAGGVEATASTGGLIMPPIMGAGAFIMAELLGLPYIKIAIAAAIPA
ncbi:TRAP transporter permease, partial [Chloroflexota bacterium]